WLGQQPDADRGLLPTLEVLAALVILFMVVRQVLALRENTRLARGQRETLEHLAVATVQFAEQADQLEEGMRQLNEVQVRVAQGDYTARAPLPEGRLLFPVAAMLNRLLDRFESLARGQEQYAQQEHLAAQAVRVARACQSLEAGDTTALHTLTRPSG